MDINPVISGGNKYCGPAVLSSLLKIDTGEAARRIRERSNVRAVRGTYIGQLKRVLEAADITVKASVLYGVRKPTLAGWLKEFQSQRVQGRVFLILAGRHWQLVSGRRYVCGITKEVVSVRDKRVKRRARVQAVYEIVKQ